MPYLPASQTVPVCLAQGIDVTVISAAAAVGLGKSYVFTLPPSSARIQDTIAFSCPGTFSVCTVQLQQSLDGGATYQNVGAAVDLFANPAGSLNVFFATAAFIPKALFRFNVVTFTGTSITMNLAVS